MVRRVVTKIGQNGKSCIVSDGAVQNIEVPLPEISEDLTFYNIWITEDMPVKYNVKDDSVKDIYVSTAPVKNGSLFRIVNYPPDKQIMNKIQSMPCQQRKHFGREIGVDIDLEGPHPFMHITATIDFAIVISGEIYLVLDEDETLLYPGDVVVQRGTNHAWSNRSNHHCKMAYVLLDGKQNE